MKKLILLCALMSMSLSVLIQADSEQIKLEQHLSGKAQLALDQIYGSGNFVVRTKVSMTAPKYEIKYTKESNPKRRSKSKADDKINILPGYPVIKNLGPSDIQKLPFDSVTTYIRPQVRKITVDILVNKSFSKGKAARAKALVREVLELKKNRDKVNMTFKDFQPELSSAGQAPGNSFADQLLKIDNLLFVAALVLFIVFLVVYIFMQLKMIAASGKNGDNSANINVNPNIEIPQAEDSGGGGGSSGSVTADGPNIKVYFDFINERNIDDLVYLLKKENVSVENISVIISYLPAKLGSRVLDSLEIQNQALVTSNILGQRLINRPYLEKLEGKIKDWLECFVGGESTFQRLFNYVSGEVKKQLMNILGKSNPDAYRLFRNNIVLFDDLKYLEDEELKMVLSEANVELLSTALVSVDEETYQKIDINLTKSAKDMIRQYLDLKGQSISKKDIESAQDYILNIVSKLEGENKVDLKGKINS